LADSWLNVLQQTVRMIDIVGGWLAGWLTGVRKLNSQLAGGQTWSIRSQAALA